MSRATKRRSRADDDDDLNEHTSNHNISARRPSGARNAASPPPEPSSDKENCEAVSSKRQNKNGKTAMGPPTQTPRVDASSKTHKRRKLSELEGANASQVAFNKELNQVEDLRYYDPEQLIEERRRIRKDYRDLSRELADSRTEFLDPDSTGLIETITKANSLFDGVKQTADATLDSRLLVSAGDLTVRRAAQSIGDTALGIDVDDFVLKCRSFMRKGPTDAEAALSGTATQRRRHPALDSDAEDEVGDEGDECNWEWLGRKVCFPNNIRPPIPGFLLGPLSVQKRIRKQTQRREKQAKQNPADAVRPEELKVQDLEKVENADLTTLCRKIWERLARMHAEVHVAEANEDVPDEEVARLKHKYKISSDGGVCLYRFTFSPKSFGQTVENLFYTSFLIRDGKVGIGEDEDGLPTLHPTNPRTEAETREIGPAKRNQGVFHLDYETWEAVIDAFSINACLIPHRTQDELALRNANGKGWYG